MLWSPNEVLAYLKEDDLGAPSTFAENSQLGRLEPIEAFGGFQTWPSSKDDFILIAENSEIHGPNPLVTIPELDSSIDLNALSTQILSADYQGLSNNKILPGKNAQLIMPDISSDMHAAVDYFFLFDSEARGFVRPTCIAYFTADKHKLIQLADQILKTLGEVAAILQHSNILHHVDDLRSLRDSLKSASSDPESSASKEIAAEARLKEIQDILDIAQSYEGNELFSKQIVNIMEYLKVHALSEKVQKLCSTSLFPETKTLSSGHLVFKPNRKKHMKNLYLICNNGLVLGLYHLYIMYKHFRRKYENIAVSEIFPNTEGDNLYFGACVQTSIRMASSSHFEMNECLLRPCRIPPTPSLDSNTYFDYLDHPFEKLLISFIEWKESEIKTLDESNSLKLSSSDLTNSSEFQSSSSYSSGYISNEKDMKEKNCKKINCRHIVMLNMIWDNLEYIKKENPGIETSFLKVLKLFDDTQKLLFSVFTQVPIVVISTPQELHTAQDFIKALSVFIPRKKEDILFVDFNRHIPLKKEQFTKIAAVNFCLSNHVIEDLLPLELLPSLCILNLKDHSLTAPRYTMSFVTNICDGSLLANVDQQIRALSSNGPVFPILVSIFLEVERTIKWWHILTSSSLDTTSAAKYVLSKGYNRLDMQIIEKLSRLCKS